MSKELSRSRNKFWAAPKRTTAKTVFVMATASVLLVATAAAAQDAPLDPQKEAEKLFKEGIDAFTKDDYLAALMKFQQAYDVLPKTLLLYNIGMCQRALFDYKGAIDSLEQYLREGGDKIPADRQKDVKNLVMEMESALPKVTILVNVIGARILVDSEEIGVAPLGRFIALNPGKHVIEARKEGYDDAKMSVVLESTTVRTIELKLRKQPSDEDGGIPPAEEVLKPGEGEEKKEKKKGGVAKAWWLWTIVGAVVVGGAVVGGVLGAKYSSGDEGENYHLTVYGK